MDLVTLRRREGFCDDGSEVQEPAVLPLPQQSFCGFRFVRWPRKVLAKEHTRIIMGKAYGDAYSQFELVFPQLEAHRVTRMLVYPKTRKPAMGGDLYRVVRALQCLLLCCYHEPNMAYLLSIVSRGVTETASLDLESLYEDAEMDALYSDMEQFKAIKQFMRIPSSRAYMLAHHPTLQLYQQPWGGTCDPNSPRDEFPHR